MTKYFGLLLLFLVEPILAQQSTLNFKDAVKIALDNNISLKKQENQQYLSKSEKVNALVQVGPQLSAFGQAWRTQGNQFIEQEARVVNDAETDNFYGTVDADLTLFNGLKNYHTIKQTDYQFEAQNASVRRTEQTIISEVASKYLQCLLDKELLEIELANLEVQQKQLQQIENFVLVGSRPEIDVFTQNAKLKTQEVKVLRAKTKLRNDKMLLARTLQIELINDFNIADPFWNVEDAKIKFSNIHIDQLFNNGLLHRSDMQESILLEKAAKSEQSSSR